MGREKKEEKEHDERLLSTLLLWSWSLASSFCSYLQALDCPCSQKQMSHGLVVSFPGTVAVTTSKAESKRNVAIGKAVDYHTVALVHLGQGQAEAFAPVFQAVFIGISTVDENHQVWLKAG